MPCIFKPDMHNTCLRIMPCLCDVCLLCCLLLSGLLLALASVSFRSCEDSFDYVWLSSSWIVLLPCGISGKMTIPSKSLLSLLARCSLFCYAYATMPTTWLSCLPNCHVKPLTHHVLANRWLAMLPLCLAPLIALLVAGEDWSLFLVGTWRCCSLLENCLLVGISLYIVFN